MSTLENGDDSGFFANRKNEELARLEATITDYVIRITASENRASEAERTFAGLHTEMAKIVALNAQLQRERDQLLKDDAATFATMEADLIEARSARIEAQSERDEAVRGRDEARGDLKDWIEQCYAIQSERDEARAALGRVVEAEREECAKIADNHERDREQWQKRHNRGRQFMSEEAKASIMDEARGEKIASEIIAKAIRARTTHEEGK